MGEYNVKINYLYNSGFIVETENNILIFDYYLDDPVRGKKGLEYGTVDIEKLPVNKKILVLSSHSHSDHYNPIIFKWKEKRADIVYIMSSDIKLEFKNDKLFQLAAYEELNHDNVNIKAFGSTDIGISFLVNVDGVNIFHAGDLNWWHWWDEPDKDNINAEKMFELEIDKLKGNNIDIAFFPVDPRLKSYYYYGGEYFSRSIAPKIFIPMHFREEFEITRRFAERLNNSSPRIIEISRRGQEIIL